MLKNYLFTIVLLFVLIPARAEFNLYNGEYGSLDIGMLIQTAGFAENNNWFGKAKENIGVSGEYWWEVGLEPHIRGELFLPSESELYGGYSFYYSQTVGHDTSGATVGIKNPGMGQTEQAYIGWRSGTLLTSQYKDLIDISYGQQDFKIGSGFILYRGSGSGGRRGGWWLGSRHSFAETIIGRLNLGIFRADGFHLKSRPRDGGHAKFFNGANFEILLSQYWEIGIMYFNVKQTDSDTIDGLDVYDIRTTINPLPSYPNLTLNAEYVYEKNGSALESHAGYAQISYLWEQLPWLPKLSYRYAHFQGDDPDTAKKEAFNPLAYGFSDWGTWWQGEITGEHVLSNSNLISHMLRLNMTPADNIVLDFIYYHFLFDQPESFNLTNAHYADEINLISSWNITRSASIIGSLAAAIPGEGGTQFTKGGNQVWLQAMLYAAYDF